MKKYMIVGAAFFAFALISGCAKSEEGKCKDKGKYWDASTKECKDEAPEVAASVAETQESCKSKAGYVWDTNSSQCKRVDYFMLVHPEGNDVRTVHIALKADTRVSIDPKRGVYVQKGNCVKVPESYLSNVIVRIQSSSWSIGWDVVCSGFAESATKCELGIYELALGDDDAILQAVTLDKERTDCKLLELD